MSINQMIDIQFGKERWIHTEGVDLSRTGFRCRTFESIESGSTIYVIFEVGARTIEADAIAIHTQTLESGETEAGFEFSSLYGSSKRTLEQYIEERASAEERDL